mmetsp:Transcript_92852/g.199135  ORF Transcript_92852/g.199135 Transcript_92852/m.199135 type:complete len:507 (-) Transcript_92852:674-2194(-)
MENADGSVIGGGGQEGEFARVKRGTAHGPVVVLQRLEGLLPEVKIEPDDAPVVGAAHNMVTVGVHRDRRYPLRTAHQVLQLLLFLEVVDAHAGLRSHHEMGLRWMECAALHLAPLQLLEGPHGLLLLQGMDDALVRGALRFRAHRGAVVALHVPRELLGIAVCSQSDSAALLVERRVLGHSLPAHCARLGTLLLLLLCLLRLLANHRHRQKRGNGLHRLRVILLVRFLNRARWGPLFLQAGIHKVDGLIGSNSEQGPAAVPGHSCGRRGELEASKGTASGHLPDAKRLIAGNRGEPLAGAVHSDAPHHPGVPLVRDGDVRGERPQVLRARQLGQQALGIYVHAHPQRPRHEVEVQAPLEPLCDKFWIRRHPAERIHLLRHDAESPLRLVLFLPRLLLLLGKEVLAGRVVRLRMPGQRHLRRRQRGGALAAFRGIVGPEVPHLRLRRWRRSDLPLPEQGHELLHPHALPLRRLESPLRRMGTAQGMQGRLRIVEFHEGVGFGGSARV